MTNTGASQALMFWHWKRPSVDRVEYETRLQDFHLALAVSAPAGFARSSSSALSDAPWANDGGEAYQDRYLMDDSGAIDTLEDWATRGTAQRAHDAAAAGVGGGVSGLYHARLGTPLDSPRHASWFSKPDGMRYVEAFDLLGATVAECEGVLWMRRLSLGPGPEFCLESPKPAALPESLLGTPLVLRPLWPTDPNLLTCQR